ncbi:acyl-CoA N-acyltransferase [Aspergillus novoparasiticus]|uniref:Acyl-CoA N-acyltransferase n=1 Tax=Aspergillus novoparasiticus TaxID=986946 RepID=A0A5N6F7W6_9EURO|nr:acyl-CoA N-acyltransferase [Aspergillus novoparasiticus]
MASILTLRRVTTLEELEPLYQIGADAFRDDPCMNWFYPGGRDHPEDFAVLWKNILQMEFFDKGKFILAATIRDADDDQTHPGRAVGFAVWERNGVCDAARSWQGISLSKRLKRFNLNFKIAYTFRLDTPRRSISWSKLDHFLHEVKSAKAGQPTESWYLSILAVSSKAQGQGVGKKLLQWGIDRSEEEDIPATLVATNAGLHLYESNGFERTGWLLFDDERQKQTVMRRDTRVS